MIDIIVDIKNGTANLPKGNDGGNAFENRVRQLLITDDWTEEGLAKTIVLTTPKGVVIGPVAIVDNKFPLLYQALDGKGPLNFTIYGKVAGAEVHNASGMVHIGFALDSYGGVAPEVYVDITSAAIAATSASLAQTGLCEAATGAAVEIVETVQNKLDRGEFVGPEGANGTNGANGAPGPNSISASTATNITGLFAGDGAHVSAPTAAQVGALPIPDEAGLFADDTINGALQTVGLQLLKNTRYDRFDQMYVRDGRAVCNDTLHLDQHTATAKYVGVDLTYRLSFSEIRFGFTGGAGECSIMMITTKLGSDMTSAITGGSCHWGVSPTHVGIEYFNASAVITRKHTHVFATPLLDNTEYVFKWVRIGDDATGWTTVTYPDGVTELITDAEWVTYAGRYAIFEHFYSSSSSRRGYFTGWRCGSDDGSGNKKYLRHDFARQYDGLVDISQTGQIYNLFSNDVHSGTALGYI